MSPDSFVTYLPDRSFKESREQIIFPSRRRQTILPEIVCTELLDEQKHLLHLILVVRREMTVRCVVAKIRPRVVICF